jgi:stress-induced morphogen
MKPALTGGSGSRYADAMARRDLIAEKLTKAFAPASLDVVDESHQHAGHAGNPAKAAARLANRIRNLGYHVEIRAAA